MRARYYSPALRRFVNADKVHGDISNALSLNRYAFVNGNPAVNVDPKGLKGIDARGGSNGNGTYNNYGNLYPLLMLEAPAHYSSVSNEANNKLIKTVSKSSNDGLKSFTSRSSYEGMVIATSTTYEAGAIFGLAYSETYVTDGKDFVYEESLTLKQGLYAGVEAYNSVIIYYGYNSLEEYKAASEKIFSKTINIGVGSVTFMYELKGSDEIQVGISIPYYSEGLMAGIYVDSSNMLD